MKSLYYFISSLPALKWGGNCPMTVDEFLESAKPYLSEKYYTILHDVSLIPKFELENAPYVDKWIDMEKFLRKRLSLIRAKNKGMNPDHHRIFYEKGYYSDYEKVAQSAMAAENPLEKEKMLDYSRWRALENLFALHLFDFEALLAYKLKLELLSKYASVNKEKAYQKFEKITENILKEQEFFNG